ncbi:MAG: nucleotidyltransferase domain-containing protein [Nocardioides sp.]
MYGDRPDPVTAATAFVAARFPHATAAFVGGSVLTERRTPTSDLDVVVVLAEPTEADPAPYRETFEHDGWIVEAFVHTPDSLERFWRQDADRRVPSMLRMCAESEVLCDPAGIADRVRADAAQWLAAGPAPLEAGALEAMRYGLTDLLDDMAGCDDEQELAFIAGAVVRDVATLALAVGGQWSGRGKGLARALSEYDADLLERLVNGHRHVVVYGDTAVLHRAAVDVLLRAGGALMAGYRSVAPPAQ